MEKDWLIVIPAGIGNAVFIFITFLTTLPGIAMPTRGWLKFSGYLTVICGLFSMVVGVYLWVLTLGTKGDFFQIWMQQDASVQDLMQTAVSRTRLA
jgi:hypothetical protein